MHWPLQTLSYRTKQTISLHSCRYSNNTHARNNIFEISSFLHNCYYIFVPTVYYRALNFLHRTYVQITEMWSFFSSFESFLLKYNWNIKKNWCWGYRYSFFLVICKWVETVESTNVLHFSLSLSLSLSLSQSRFATLSILRLSWYPFLVLPSRELTSVQPRGPAIRCRERFAD